MVDRIAHKGDLIEVSAKKTKRDASVEFYRCGLMFGIVLLHCSFAANKFQSLCCALLSCVCGFVFISGWYGLKFAPSKLLRLYGVLFYCAIVSTFLRAVMGGWSCQTAVNYLCKYAKADGLWFVHAYALLMLLVPMVNVVIEPMIRGESRNEQGMRRLMAIIVPLAFGIYVWGWSAECCNMIPSAHGLDMYSALTLLGTYAIARVCRMMCLEKIMSRNVAIPLFGVFLILFLISGAFFFPGFGRYNSFFAVVLAGSVFYIVKMSRIPLLSLFVIMGPSMFSVYILHMTGIRVSDFLMMKVFPAGSSFISVLLVSLVVFLLCVLLDIPRRIIVAALAKKISAICRAMDSQYEQFLSALAKHGLMYVAQTR